MITQLLHTLIKDTCIGAIRSILRRDLKACKGCHVDITLKDVETVQYSPERVRCWVELTRQVIEEVW